MNPIFRAGLAVVALATVASAAGCVASRPARNGVFNENVYLRKDFLIKPSAPDATGKVNPDPGWEVVGTIVQTSAPNPLVGQFFTGLTGELHLLRFQATQDHLQVVDQRETTANPGNAVTPMVLDSWAATNVDLKYRVNLDGEQTNFYEENQELPWDQRQWVKLNLAKNDLSDVALMGYDISESLEHCTYVGESSTVLIPNSVKQEIHDDPSQDYLSWKVQMTLPLNTTLPECLQMYNQTELATAFNPNGGTGKYNVTLNILYSMKRATPMSQITYKPLVVDEKDPIHHKYASMIQMQTRVWDESSQLQASRELQNRYDPQKDIVWYFEKTFPENYKAFFCNQPAPGSDGKPVMSDDGITPTHACDMADDPTVDTIRSATNAILSNPGVNAKGRVVFKNYNEDLAPGQAPREYGDIRYNFFRWSNNLDNSDTFAGVTMSRPDPRSGEIQSTNIVFQNFEVKDYYVQKIDAYLQSLGASQGVNSAGEWLDGPKNCKDGDTIPIVPATQATVNATNTLYSKMQQYMNRPAATYGALGPSDFIAKQDNDFMAAYYAIIPYQIFADPATNPYVIPEGGQGVYGPPAQTVDWQALKDESEFYKRSGDMDHGLDPYDATTGTGTNIQNAASFLNRMRDLTTNHLNMQQRKLVGSQAFRMDASESFSFESIIQHDARHCVQGQWETKAQWVQSLIDTYWREVMWHEFGHSLGLDHNFMGSIDRNNFPKYKDAAKRDRYTMYSNSVMEYTANASRIFDGHGNLWGPWDQAAIGWIYANSCSDSMDASGNTIPALNATTSAQCNNAAQCKGSQCDPTLTWVSGQATSTLPWNDPLGWTPDGKTEIQLMSCNSAQTRYTPLCKAGDQGTTPSEIIANEIATSEWNYQWRNFRVYRKFWNNSQYAAAPAGLMYDMRKFISLWVFDWSASELTDTLRRIGIKNPNPNGSDLQYFTQLTNKFNAELSAANQMVASYHKAVIQQGSGERPFATVYDKFYGDVTQQGIILDKFFAMQSWVALWPTDNYDINQAGSYLASYAGWGDSTFNSIAEDAVDSMVGGQYNVYPYFRPLAVTQFSQDTHSPAMSGRVDVRDWVGGQTFYRLQDFLDYFRNIAVTNNVCSTFEGCLYDPRPLSDTHNEFVGPDKRVWIWSYVPDRAQYVAVQKDRNTASYVIVRAYNDDVVTQLDDGAYPGRAYGLELPMKYFLDAYNTYR